MITSAPWARLTMLSTRQTRPKPTPTATETPPASRPRMTSWTKLATTWPYGSALVPVGRRVHRLGVRDARGKDSVVDAVLDLLHDHRLVGVDPARVELDLPEEHGHVQGRERIAHLGRIERAGVLDRPLEGQARGGRLRDVVVGIAQPRVFRLVSGHIVGLAEVKGRGVLDLRSPLRSVIYEVGVSAERGYEVGRGRTHRVGEYLGVELLLLGRLVDCDRLGQVARVEHDVGVGRLRGLHLGGEVCGPVLVLLEKDDIDTLAGRVVVDGVGDLEAEVVVRAEY